MKVGDLMIECPAMVVRNTGWTPWSDRRADELLCRGVAQVDDQTMFSFQITFPSCLVRFVEPGTWMVDPVTAAGPMISIDYPREPILRKGRLMIAQPVDNVVEASWIKLPGGRTWRVRAPLPSAPADPGFMFGLMSYTVRPVTIAGEILEPSKMR